MHLGRADRRIHVVCGPAVSTLARLEGDAAAGEILMSRAAKSRLQQEWAPRRPRGKSPRVATATMRRYVAPHLLEVMDYFEGEYRRAVMVFFETRGWSLPKMQVFVQALVSVLDRYDGILVSPDLSPHGVKWLCAFGAPRAHEDDVDRAARAALELMSACSSKVAVRGGMQEGTLANIWIGTARRRNYELMGDVTNTAARTMAKAAWGEVLITREATERLRSVRTEPRGSFTAKGKAKPLELEALTDLGTMARPLQVSAPLVGRDAEIATLKEAIEKALAGRGSAIAIKGEAGMGKSRLKWEASKLAREAGLLVHEGRAPSFGGISYRTIAEAIRTALPLSEGAAPDEIVRRVRAAGRALGLSQVDTHHLAEVLGARFPRSAVEHLDARSVRLNNMIAIRAYLHGISRQQPRVVVLEDMHWADEATREAAAWLNREISEVPLVLILLHRPGYDAPEGVPTLELQALRESIVQRLLEAHLGVAQVKRWVPAPVRRLISSRAEGNPFYVEELVRHLVESGVLAGSDDGYVLAREPTAEDLPAGVEAIIATRLDRLSGEVKKIAQLAAVIGRSFLFELLFRLDPVHAELGVTELCRRELVFDKSQDPREYIFKHALTRDVAYGSVLAGRRRKLHRAVAEAIEASFTGTARQPYLAMLGHHWEQAAEPDLARPCYLGGATGALKRFAFEEAERLLWSYLSLVKRPTAESIRARNRLAHDVLQVRGRMKEAEAEHRTALQEAKELGDASTEAASLWQIAVVQKTTGRMQEAEAGLEAALAIHRRLGERSQEATVLSSLANIHGETGRLEEARAGMEEALRIYREMGSRQREAVVLGNLGIFDHLQGRFAEADAAFERSLALARDAGDWRQQGRMLMHRAVQDFDQRKVREAQAGYEEALAISRRIGDRRFESIILGNLGALLKAQGMLNEARAVYEESLRLLRDAGDRRGEAIVLGNFASLLEQMGLIDEARAGFDEALAMAIEVGAVRFQGHAHLIRADLSWSEGKLEEARRGFEESRRIAERIHNRHGEGQALRRLAALELVTTGDAARSLELARASESCLEAVNDRNELVLLYGDWGHANLAGGASALEAWERARAVYEELPADVRSGLVEVLDRLRRAQDCFDRGAPLVCGCAPSDVPEVWRRWLEKNRPDALSDDPIR